MKKRRWTIWPALVMTALLSGCAAAPAAEETPPPDPVTIRTEAAPSLGIAGDGAHPALLRTDSGGDFRPREEVTRRILCAALRSLLTGLPAGRQVLSDFQPGRADRPAAALYDAGLLPGAWGERYQPDAPVMREELSEILGRIGERLPAGERERAEALAEAALTGALGGPDVTGYATEPVLRQELAVMLERLCGRTPDETALFLGEYLPGDVTAEDYAWAWIADAVTAGEIPRAEPGVHRAYGWLYAVWDDGTLVRDMDYGVWTFGPDGRYTTGSEELDDCLAEALRSSGADGLPREEALEAAYLYVKYNYEYLVRPEDMEPLPPGVTGFEFERALRFFRYGGGTCYGFASAFGLLARVLGENAYVVSAEINEYHGPHSFVVIPRDGVDLIYDVELEATRQERHPDLSLFGIRNFDIYYYWYEPDWE